MRGWSGVALVAVLAVAGACGEGERKGRDGVVPVERLPDAEGENVLLDVPAGRELPPPDESHPPRLHDEDAECPPGTGGTGGDDGTGGSGGEETGAGEPCGIERGLCDPGFWCIKETCTEAASDDGRFWKAPPPSSRTVRDRSTMSRRCRLIPA